MSIQLNKEETELWKKRTWYQMGGLTVATLATIMLMFPFGMIVIVSTLSGLAWLAIFVASMPRVYYYAEDEGAEDEDPKT